MGRVGLIAASILLSMSASGRGRSVEFAADGKSDYVISLPVKASPVVRFAADELARYLKQMSGASLEVRPGELTARKAIMLMPVRTSSDTQPLEIKVDDSLVAIIGTEPQLLQGAYRLLDLLGCRFLAPQLSHYNGSGEVISSSPNLLLHCDGLRETARLRFRKIYVEEGHSHTPENLAQIVEWMPKVGYNTLVVPTNYQGAGRVKWDNFRDRVAPECQKRGITIEVGGHGYQNFLNADMEGGKLFEQHPDWFGQDAQGVRHKEKGRVFCTSNAQAVEYLIANFIAYVKERPEIQIYDFWPPDGAKWCECESCRKLGSPPDRQAILIEQVQERVKAVRPELRLEMIAYAAALSPPQREKVDKNVLVDFCPIGQQFDYQVNDPAAEKNKQYVDALSAWRKAFDGDISIYSYYRKYAWDSLPVIIPHYMQKDLQWYATMPVQGVSTYAEPGDWFTYELNHYVLAALAWDPDADVDAIVKKFCAARYGDSADAAQTALLTLEDITRNTCSIPNSSLKSAKAIETDWGRATKISEGIAAEAKRATDPAAKRSLECLALMCTYAQRDLEIQRLRVSNADNDQIRQKAAALHEFLARHADDGVFLIKDQRMSPARMLRRYGVTDKGG